ncbi:disease resistance protein RUN1 [Physcomitrium patens]|uniref:NB-ARC domain-containing protein n=2 Tax=Physcomitrium patens TaxID=3218 RepID=A0A2K1KG83_PHYPA|nr:disease resistance-like protein DSC1 [Physcomitrium patens]PNR52800.1 hypothetical protein PHYPA_009175 [Physcomitrium patens]|eukprot:XP_024378517.1 disease resistance-like protein DSC1 [Physcomitrella patens]
MNLHLVGKATLAKEIYNCCAAQKKFRHMTYLEIDLDKSNVQVRPMWSRKSRKQVLWDLLRVQMSTSNDYISWFRKASTMGPVLIVLDGVHKIGQFEFIIPFAKDLHAGSRIIITSRDGSIFNNIAGRAGSVVRRLFMVSKLGPSNSNKLFNWHAFQAEEAPEDYRELAEDIVKSCGGLPLALKVFGSSLCNRTADRDRERIWPEAVRALRQSGDVMDVLRWSYDILTESEKHMFVDITCLFYGRPLKEAKPYWKSCEDCASCGGVQCLDLSLRNLFSKNLAVVVVDLFSCPASRSA